jgi:hypothetical protein
MSLRPTVMLIESNPNRRKYLADALRIGGHHVTAVSSAIGFERWPTGHAVIVEFSSFSAWWDHVGAAQVVVLADTSADGVKACVRGATAWVPRDCGPETLLAALEGGAGLPASAA